MARLDDASLQTLWKDRLDGGYSFFCPLCKAPRRIPYRPTPGGFKHYFQVAVAAVFFTVVTWPIFTWKGIISFVPFWIAFEGFYRVRVRTALECRRCGFDPYLYMVDAKKGRAQVEKFWRGKFAEKGKPFPADVIAGIAPDAQQQPDESPSPSP